MRKLLFTLLFLAVGCTEQFELPTTVNVTFKYSFVESGKFPTKGMADEIATKIPSEIQLILVNTTTNEQYNTVTG